MFSLLFALDLCLSGFQSSLLLIHFSDRPNSCSHCTAQKPIRRYVTLTFKTDEAELRSVTEIAPKSPFLCEQSKRSSRDKSGFAALVDRVVANAAPWYHDYLLED